MLVTRDDLFISFTREGRLYTPSAKSQKSYISFSVSGSSMYSFIMHCREISERSQQNDGSWGGVKMTVTVHLRCVFCSKPRGSGLEPIKCDVLFIKQVETKRRDR